MLFFSRDFEQVSIQSQAPFAWKVLEWKLEKYQTLILRLPHITVVQASQNIQGMKCHFCNLFPTFPILCSPLLSFAWFLIKLN